MAARARMSPREIPLVIYQEKYSLKAFCIPDIVSGTEDPYVSDQSDQSSCLHGADVVIKENRK